MANSTALQVMRTALQQYAYTESPAGSNNNKYGRAFGLNRQPWCAEFVWWCGEQPKGSNPIAKSANAAYIQDQTVSKKGGKYVLKQTANNTKKKAALSKVKFGDSISFNFSGGTSRAHTALVVGRWGNYIYCIEGNTSFGESGSQSNGGCVALRERYYTTGVCIVRPKYTAHEWHVPTAPYTGKTVTLPARGWFEYGDENSKVGALQEALSWANGYKLDADSDFRSKTFAEVVIFQVANNLEPDGQFGEKCIAKMNELIAKFAAAEADQPQEETVTTEIADHPALYVPTKGEMCYDLSDHQGALSKAYFEKIKKKGVKCVILRATYTKCAFFGLRVDAHFHNNIKNAIAAGMHIGTYHFSSALNENESAKEAKFHMAEIEPYKEHIDLPVAMDREFGVKTADGKPRFTAAKAKKLGKTKGKKIVDAFLEEVEKAGYEPMLYANLSFFNNYLPAGIYKKYKIWIAQYNDTCDYKHPYYMWQFTSNNGKLDENVFGTQDTGETSTEEASTETAETSTATTETSTSTAEASTTKTKAEKLNETAIKECWAYGTKKKKYAYPDGAPKKAYKTDLNAMFPDRSGWRRQTRLGASCDVFAATAIRASGADKKFPRMLDKAIPYLKEHTGKWRKIKAVDGKYKPKQLKGGDVVVCLYKGGGGHICIVVEKDGKKYIAEAGYTSKRWPVLAKKLSTMNKSSYKMLRVYRARG